MGAEKEENTGEVNKDPKPLSEEGQSTQMDLPLNPKVTNTSTKVGYRNKDFIKNIIDTPKEGPVEEPKTVPSSSSGPISNGPPKEPPAIVIARLGGDGDQGGGSVNTPPVDPEGTKDGAHMLIDGFNALFLFFIGIWSKNNDPKDYEVETEEKTRLKKYLSGIMQRSGKSINPIWLFIGLFILTYIPLLRKGWQHRQMVGEEREKNRPGVTIINEPRRRRRRKSGGNDDDVPFSNIEVIK